MKKMMFGAILALAFSAISMAQSTTGNGTEKPAPPTLRSYLSPEKENDQAHWARVATRTCALVARAPGYSLAVPIRADEEKQFGAQFKSTELTALRPQAEACFNDVTARDKNVPWQAHLAPLSAPGLKEQTVAYTTGAVIGTGVQESKRALGALKRGIFRR